MPAIRKKTTSKSDDHNVYAHPTQGLDGSLPSNTHTMKEPKGANQKSQLAA